MNEMDGIEKSYQRGLTSLAINLSRIDCTL